MANPKKFLDQEGLTHLMQKFQDYPNNEILGVVINAIDEAKADKNELFSGSYNDLTDKPTIPAATTVTNTLASGTLIATINGTNIYAPAYTDADGVSY